jgi:VWFA-related protein
MPDCDLLQHDLPGLIMNGNDNHSKVKMSLSNLFVHRRLVSLAWRLLVIFFLSFNAAETQAQESNQPQKPSEDEVIRVRSHLVNIDVMVKDKKGRYITDLRSEDFVVFENGLEQKVNFFDAPLVRGNQTNQNKLTAEARSLTSAGVPRNIISLVLDGQTTDLTNLKQVREGTLRYIREQITDVDTVALFAVTSGLQLLQPFTQDRTQLIAAVETAFAGSASSRNFEKRDIAENIATLRETLAGAPSGPITDTVTGSASAQAMIASRVLQQFLRLRTTLSLQQSRPILAALAAICEGQRTIQGRKTLVLFSQGFVTPAVLDWQVQSTIDLANRANVAIYIIDSAGLRAAAPQSGSLVPGSPLRGISAITNQEQRIQSVGGENVFDHGRYEGLNREQDVLYRISGATGGQFIKGTNDIGKGLNRIDEEIRSRYTLAYRSTDSNFDGSFRKLKVVVRRPEAQAQTRPGYYAVAVDEIVLLSPEDKKLMSDFTLAETTPAIPLSMEIVPFRHREGRYIVPLWFEVPPSAVKFERIGSGQRMQIDVLGLIRGTDDQIQSRLGGSFDVRLTSEQYKSIISNNIFYRQDMELFPGTYTLEVIVRDRMSGKMAARRERLVLPEADSEFSTTAVVLSRHVEPARRPPAEVTAEGGDVLSYEGAQIRPSPTREFRRGDNLIVFFKLYNAQRNTDMSKPLVRVKLTIMKDGKAVLRPVIYQLSEPLAGPVPHLTFARYMSLSALPPGKYDAMIQAEDMVSRKMIERTASFTITQ